VRTALIIGDNCFVPSRVPVRMGIEGPIIGYADGFKEGDGKVVGNIHLDVTVDIDGFSVAGMSSSNKGEPEVLYAVVLLSHGNTLNDFKRIPPPPVSTRPL
jgi:hypothetical protein